jgi:hypothetical protein
MPASASGPYPEDADGNAATGCEGGDTRGSLPNSHGTHGHGKEYGDDSRGVEALVANQLGAVPEGQRIGEEDDQHHNAHAEPLCQRTPPPGCLGLGQLCGVPACVSERAGKQSRVCVSERAKSRSRVCVSMNLSFYSH